MPNIGQPGNLVDISSWQPRILRRWPQSYRYLPPMRRRASWRSPGRWLLAGHAGDARHRGQGVESAPPGFGGQSPLVACRSGWRVAGSRAGFGASSSASRVEAGRYHSVDRMLLDGPGGHLGDHTGADDRLSATGGPREPMVNPRRQLPRRTGLPSRTAGHAWPRRCCCHRWRATRPSPESAAPLPGWSGRHPASLAAFASRPDRSCSSTCLFASTRYSATSSSCSVSSEVAPRAVVPRAGSASSASQRTSSMSFPSQGTPSASPAA